VSRGVKVALRTRTVGQCFGTVGQIVSLRTGKVLAETGVCPYGFDGAAILKAESVAADRGYIVVPEVCA